jgi:PKD repeat protein
LVSFVINFKRMKRFIGLLAVLLMGMDVFPQTYNYAEALQKSLYFYDANKCGVGVADGVLAYRGDCHVTDTAIPLNTEMTNLSSAFIESNSSILDPDGDGTVDLSGGFHDAGDHVQFGLPQTYSTSTIEWAFYEFRDAFVNIGEDDHMMDILRWGSDYYLKCTFRDASGDIVAFCYQVGEGNIDHNLWAPPELFVTEDYPRPAYFATTETPASDQCAGAAASLALSYLNNLDSDSDYANECLDVAVALYDFAVANRGIGYDGGFYNSSYDDDELAWAAVWLYIATGTESYLTDIISQDDTGVYTGWMSKIINSVEDDWQNIWVHSWDTKWGGIFAKLAPITNDPFHWWIFRWNLEYWSGVEHEESSDGNYLTKTPDGFSWLAGWGSARYNAAAQFQGMVYKKYADDRFDEWMTDQINYIMGDNPLGRSYIVGYSDNYAEHPHHRAAHGSATNSMFDPVDHKHILWGALVGGPGMEDEHIDATSDYIYNEVAIDYNAGLVGALAGHMYYFGEGMEPVSPFPTPDPPLEEYGLQAKIEQVSNERSQISIEVMNEAAFPPRKEVDIVVRYYFNIDELFDYDQDINDVSFAVYYDENAVFSDAVSATGPFEFNAELGIYYMEFQWPESGFYGTREYQFALIVSQDASYTGRWDATNDYSNTGLTDEYQSTEYIVMFADGVQVNGVEPSGNSAPTANISATPTSGEIPLTVAFDASQSTDSNGDALTYSWDFGDGSTDNGVTVSHTYTVQGSYVAELTVSDGELSDVASIIISAGIEPVNEAPEAAVSASTMTGDAPLVVSFDASGSSDPNGDALTYTWDFGDGSTATGVTVDHTFSEAGTYTVSLVVSDGELTAVDSIEIQVNSSEPTCNDPITITIPFENDGSGEYCYVTSEDIGNINSWNMEVVEINGVDFTNEWSSNLPAKIGGKYYIYLQAQHSWSHFEAAGTKSAELTKSGLSKVEIYPNPFEHSTIISIDDPNKVNEILIFDVMGKFIRKMDKSTVSSSLELGAELSSGMYIIKIRTDNQISSHLVTKN